MPAVVGLGKMHDKMMVLAEKFSKVTTGCRESGAGKRAFLARPLSDLSCFPTGCLKKMLQGRVRQGCGTYFRMRSLREDSVTLSVKV